ncbi:uncharacterized protein PV07_08777 [Cladophialophora immunda]|uniref:Amidase domain-containing protein n=1 Tax=Cladophialophora immunda TaxID=569365 RepID=A0A0D1ZCY6_9EURO|nr:uncharacterized protein PV07_08777 [Cladophialophora immunda]KIW25611.1 hypothetical protein PV07_08777 [Cladophialophora immunda]OQV11115.1 hypothetical protein CLAIMM_15010 [Cladophialophora immunda]
MFNFTLKTAKARDGYLRQTGKPVGQLHGLSVSTKDCFNVVDKPVERNAAVADILLNGDVVLYVKTNVPAAMMMLATVNTVTGRTLNPLDRGLAAPGPLDCSDGSYIADAMHNMSSSLNASTQRTSIRECAPTQNVCKSSSRQVV